MPKLKVSEYQERRNRINACISRHSTLQMVDNRQMAAAAGLSYETFCRRRKNPEAFRIGELLKLSKYLHCQMTEMVGEDL